MSLKFATAALLAAAFGSAPAYACSMTQGSPAISPPSFQNADPAWLTNNGTFTVGGGTAKLAVPGPNQWGYVVYGGAFINTGDICVQVVLPDANTGAGIVFGDTEAGDYMFEIWGNGEADVSEWTPQGWLSPVAGVTSPLVKTGANATNELRITWSATSASAYINGQLFQTFPVSAFQGNKIGFEVQNGDQATTPVTVSFSSLSITQVSQ
jgi:hypothetical protein